MLDGSGEVCWVSRDVVACHKQVPLKLEPGFFGGPRHPAQSEQGSNIKIPGNFFFFSLFMKLLSLLELKERTEQKKIAIHVLKLPYMF